MIAAGEPKAAVVPHACASGRTTVYSHLATTENLDQAA
jgi:hypothetical protein